MNFCFYDLETFGTDPGRDRIAQFAVQKTDAELRPVADPIVEYCQPSDWPLPQPEACLITGITPGQAQQRGVPEWRFCESLLEALSGPDSCIVGYNSTRFDDSFVQHLCWRNFHEPYGWFWQRGNSRWDILTATRAAFALRPEGLIWPDHPDGSPSLKLEDLAQANQLPQPKAHDALGDVTATIALAAKLRAAQPRLFDYALGLRDKKRVRDMIVPGEVLVHVSGMVAARHRCLTLWLPVCPHPTNANEWLGIDLRGPLQPWLEWEADELAEVIFCAEADLPEGIERPRAKSIAINKAPFLAPLSTLNAVICERADLDQEATLAKAAVLVAALETVAEKLSQLQQQRPDGAQRDVEARLYDGFVSGPDRRRCESVVAMPLDDLAQAPNFDDNRLQELLFRFRARHAEQTLSAGELEEWRELSRKQLEYAPQGGLTLAQYFAELEARSGQATVPQRELLRELWQWGETLAQRYGLAA